MVAKSKIKPKTRKRSRIEKWTEEHYVTAYELARDGLTDPQIAQAMDISYDTIIIWKQKYPSFQNAITRGRQTQGEGAGAFIEYIYQQLDPDLQTLWDELETIHTLPNPVRKVQMLFKDKGLRTRQHLFIHALVAYHFNPSKACKFIGISKVTLDAWVQGDPDFGRLIDEVLWHKKNFFESKLIQLVHAGSESATLLANKTLNRDRGYGEKVKVEHSGVIEHAHTHVDISELELSQEVKSEIAKALRLRRKNLQSSDLFLGEVINGTVHQEA